jgi:hypothetical protein
VRRRTTAIADEKAKPVVHLSRPPLWIPSRGPNPDATGGLSDQSRCHATDTPRMRFTRRSRSQQDSKVT